MNSEQTKEYLNVLNTTKAAFDVALNLSSYPSLIEYNTVKTAKEMVCANIATLSEEKNFLP